MNRFQTELQRLYRAPSQGGAAGDPQELTFAGPDGRVRAMVLELARPVAWDDVARLWHAVQADLQWPAPAIAVSGGDAYQLWFSLAHPVPAEQAHAVLAALCRRYLAHVPADRLVLHPAAAAGTVRVPPFERTAGCWSAFVAPDLAPLFSDERLLDLAPGVEAQADLLSRLQSTPADEFQGALARLTAPPVVPASAAPGDGSDPRRFLLEVMNDRTVDLHLRIEAAKALLPHVDGGRAA